MDLIHKLKRTYSTARYLKSGQILYRLYYSFWRINHIKKKRFKGDFLQNFSLVSIPASENIISQSGDQYSVRLLNLEKTYLSGINWADEEYGRLWNYNLQYADFLEQDELPVKVRESLMIDLYSWLYTGKLKPEPYPASLRIMNVIRFIQKHTDHVTQSEKLLDGLYSELHFLSNRVEYHLSGNHLLENGFALLMGGSFLDHQSFLEMGRKILAEELNEQILSDGAHYERSPMYHNIILFRVLEAISYLPEKNKLKMILVEYAEKMISWMNNMTFKNGQKAHFNDSVDGVAYTKKNLAQIANKLDINTDISVDLAESGYRRFNIDAIELIVDAEGIKPDHQPGHAHADSLSFVLNLYNNPLIVDPAISTYEPNERRKWERSTKAHNTVTVSNQNSADVWSAFRVGRRPHVTILNENESSIRAKAVYSIPSEKNLEHTRTFSVSESTVTILDNVSSGKTATGRLYLAPGIDIQKIEGDIVVLSNRVKIHINKSGNISSFDYQYCEDFNQTSKAKAIKYDFSKKCSTEIISELAK